MKKGKDDQSTKKLSGINNVGEVVNANPKLTSFSREFQLVNLFLLIKRILWVGGLKKKKKEIRSFSLIIFGLISVLWVFKHVWRTEKLLSRKFDLGKFNTKNKTDGVPPDKATRDWIKLNRTIGENHILSRLSLVIKNNFVIGASILK